MTKITTVILSLLLSASSIAFAQQVPSGYLSLDQYDNTRGAAVATNAKASPASALTASAPANASGAGVPTTALPKETAPAVPASSSSKPAISYDAVRGASLRATLEQWAAISGWQPIVWKLPEDTDFTLGGSDHFEGDFVAATRSFINSLGAEAELRVHFSRGNRLVVVEPLQ